MPNPRQKILIAIIICKNNPAINFSPQRSFELAPGVIMVLNAMNENFVIFFDPKLWRVSPDCGYDVVRGTVSRIMRVTAQSWPQAFDKAKTILICQDGNPVSWHDEPISLEL